MAKSKIAHVATAAPVKAKEAVKKTPAAGLYEAVGRNGKVVRGMFKAANRKAASAGIGTNTDQNGHPVPYRVRAIRY